MSFFSLLASKRALEEARERAYALCETLRQDHAETQRELREALEAGLQLQRQRDEAVADAAESAEIAYQALVVAGMAETWRDIRRLPEWGSS